MKRIKLSLKEMVSDIIYHVTTANNVLDILKTNSFELTTSLGQQSDSNLTNELYYFSVSSVKFGGYAHRFSPENTVNLVLDGRKFNQRYKSYAFDYWGQGFRSTLLNSRDVSFHRYDEEELRIVSNSMRISKANEYIKEIHISISEKEELDSRQTEQRDKIVDILFNSESISPKVRRDINSYATLHKIPVYIYANFPAFKVLDKRKAYCLSRDTTIGETISSFLSLYNGETLDSREKVDAKNYLYITQDLINEFLNTEAPFETGIKRIYTKDLQQRISNEIHNMKRDSVGRIALEKITLILRKNRGKNLEDLLVILAKKLYKVYGNNIYKALEV